MVSAQLHFGVDLVPNIEKCDKDMLELHELDELKAAYNLMDERLDGQEIVSDEQLREAMMRRLPICVRV